MSIKQVVILAGGKGTTFNLFYKHPANLESPKAMLPINEKPLLEHIIYSLKAGGISDIILAVAYGKDSIREHFKDGSQQGVRIRYLEDECKGHVRALKLVEPYVDDLFVVCYGDHYFSPELAKKLQEHQQRGLSETYFRLSHLWPNALMKVDDSGRITEIGPWNVGECGPFREYDGPAPRHKPYLQFGNPVSKTFHVFSKKIFEVPDWDCDFLSFILRQLSEKGQTYARQHSEIEIHIHNFFCYLAAQKILGDKRYEELKERKEAGKFIEQLENDIDVEIKGVGKFSWEPTTEQIKQYEEEIRRRVLELRKEFSALA